MNYKYITGVSALNIPCYGIQCDWHLTDLLKTNNFQIHPVNYKGAVDIFGNYGIYDNTLFFQERGYNVANVLVANPIRALLDLLYFNIVVKKKYPHFLTLESYMLEDINFDEFIRQLNKLESSLENKRQIELLKKWRAENEVH